jgi:hypothetical protein
MLAAAPAEQTRNLQLFNLALSIVGSGSNIPAPLATYFDEVLRQARDLASNPAEKHGSVLPEAIQIALDLRSDSSLAEALSRVRSIAEMKPEEAQKVMLSLERLFASGN